MPDPVEGLLICTTVSLHITYVSKYQKCVSIDLSTLKLNSCTKYFPNHGIHNYY